MTAIKVFVASAMVLAACCACTAVAREATNADAFLRRIYAPYVAGDTTVHPTGKAAPTIFDARLAALIRKDQARPSGEVGVLDQDPICDCQDFDRLELLSIKTLYRGPEQTIAKVRLINGNAASTLTFILTRSKRGWRVADIRTRAMPSLVAFLRPGTVRR